MKKRLLHTPEGVRDIYGKEYEKKLTLQAKLLQELHLYGYQDIETPTIEYFDIFSSRIGTIPSKELYKFFDKEGNTLALRPDFTPSIARASAKYFMEETMPMRFCYMGNTFINGSDFQGRLKESTQIGAELLCDGSIEADAEMISLMISCMKACGLHDFQVTIGNVDFFKGLCVEYGINEEAELELREMISNKNYFGAKEILNALSLPENVMDMILNITEMFGSLETVNEAMKSVTNEQSVNAIKRLNKIHELLELEGIAQYVTYDLGMLSKYHYYTGIIFRAYTYGSGDAIMKGGRYDHLISEFGKNAAAIGFAVVVDQLLSVISRQNIEIAPSKQTYLYFYEEGNYQAAKEKVQAERKLGKHVILMKKENDVSEAAYQEYALRHNLTILER